MKINHSFQINSLLKMIQIKALKELSISPGVLVHYTYHVTLIKVWIVNKQRKT